MKITAIESDYKVQLPAEWVDELGLHGLAALEKGPDGIVIRPCPELTWDEVFAEKLSMGAGATASDLSEVKADDYLF